MNIQSEIDFFSELTIVDKARFMARLMVEVGEEVKAGPVDPARLRFANEINQRLGRLIYQILSEDTARPKDDVIIRMLLGTRTNKDAERIVNNAYRRIVTAFDTHDTTVLLNN
jgi:exoribonuclease II